MGAALNLTGMVFGKLSVLDRSHRAPGQSWKWRCRCVCGRVVLVQGAILKAGKTISCASCASAASSTTHGMSRTPLYLRWRSMLERCRNPNNSEYRNYGGRGIGICERWRNFEAFACDMGAGFAEHLTLDRIDVNGDYEPSNCRWLTRAEQQRNKRTNHRVTWCGRTMAVQDWAELLGIKPNTLIYRLRRHWPVERAMTEGADPAVLTLLSLANGGEPE